MAGSKDKNEPVIRRVADINEKELLDSMDGFGNKQQAVPASAPKIQEGGKNRQDPEVGQEPQEEKAETASRYRKPPKEAGYKSVFLQPRELKDRQCVYISRELHETILAIVSEIAVKSMTVGAFIDTVLRQHLEENKQEINNLYRRKREDLIK